MSRPFKFALGATVRQERAGHEISEDDLRAVNEHTLTPVSAKDVAAFKMDLCNDQIDGHISRFPKEELQHISDHLIVGKPLMVNHDMPGLFSTGSLPVGKFFRSQIVKENGITSVQPDVFLLRGHGEDDIIAKIEAGILAGTSISFALDRPECSSCGCDIRDCAHIPGEEVDDEVCHVILKEVTDVFEGSIVPLGSQGTEFVEARGSDGEPVLPLKDAIKQARWHIGGATGEFHAVQDVLILPQGVGVELSVKEQVSRDIADASDALIRSAVVVKAEIHPGDETDDELRTSIQEDLERVHELSLKHCHPEFNK